jgi:subtilisin family serine protease
MSSSKVRRGRSGRILLVLTMVLGLAFSALPVLGQDAGLQVPDDVVSAISAEKAEATYIIQMIDDPVVAYDGGIKGLAATKPKNGKKIDPNSGKVVHYVDYLKGKHNAALSGIGVGPEKKLYDYTYTFNGFAARLTGSQAAALMASADVQMVTADELMKPATVSTPDFSGLTGDGGAWDLGYTGDGVIVGIIDTGIWPESESFTDRTGTNPNGKAGKLGPHQIPGWHGKCTPGEEFNASDCNQKIVGAQWFNSGYGGDAGVKALWPWEYASTRDGDGHGSHTASTAAGNSGVGVVVDGENLGSASGMAPDARIAAYKVCWGDVDTGGCFSSDSVAAIDQAVADGVDVLNFSISGSRTSVLDPVEVAFLFAADAGIFVAASAGNAGGTSTVAHNSPWLTTVAAGTHDRYFEGTVTLGDGAVYAGAMMAVGPVSGDLVYAGDAGDNLCNVGSLDPAVVAGKIVLCDRGAIARVDKSAAVAEAGGIGMIHANTSANSINADLHFVPTIHIDHVDGAAARAYAQTVGATATLAGGIPVVAEAPEVASFSSRGPGLASSDLLKPDIMAPGVDIIAAVAPPFNGGRDFDSYSGTSMSSPHIAGFGALLTQAHPGWSPAMMKSALMTTASQETNQGNPIPGNPFGYGAGQAEPTSAIDPGLVYDAGWNDWIGFIFELDDRSDLNYPSITIGELAGSQTVARTVTNVGSAGTYDVSVSAPAGVDVVVTPSSLTLAEGESATYEVMFTTTETATIGDYAFGSLTWTHGPHAVRSPLTVRPVQLAAPGEVHDAGADGSLSFDVTFGYEGDFGATAAGLVPADMQAAAVADDPANDINAALGTCDWSTFPYVCTGITWHEFEVPVGAEYARFSLFDEYTSGADDLDLYVWGPGPSYPFFGSSGSGTSAEEVSGIYPAPGRYEVAVHGWQTDGGGTSDYTLFSWAFGPDMGNLTVTAPIDAVLGATESIDLAWVGLELGTRYLGAVVYNDGSTDIGSTIIRIDTD